MTLEDVFDEGGNQDFFRVIARHFARGERTLKRAFKVRGQRERYEAMLQDAAQDFWAAQQWGKVADGARAEMPTVRAAEADAQRQSGMPQDAGRQTGGVAGAAI